MFVIMVYDIHKKRVGKILKIGRKYLTWVQNSVLEGEIRESAFEALKSELKKRIEEDEDSVMLYTFREKTYTSCETLGIKKGGEEIII